MNYKNHKIKYFLLTFFNKVNFKLKNCGNNLEIATIIYKNIVKTQ